MIDMQRVNKKHYLVVKFNTKQNFEIDIPASSGCQGNCQKYYYNARCTKTFNFPWLPLEAALPVFNVYLFFLLLF